MSDPNDFAREIKPVSGGWLAYFPAVLRRKPAVRYILAAGPGHQLRRDQVAVTNGLTLA
jgi:hypothetical protein